MPACSVKYCKKSSKTSNLQKDGITFHLFPRNVIQRRRWAEVCNRPTDWVPTYSSTICSRHFEDSQFIPPPNSRRLLFKHAMPTLLLTRHELDMANLTMTTKNVIQRVRSRIAQSTQGIKTEKHLQNASTYLDIESDIKPVEYLQMYVKELLPDIDDANAVYVIIVNNENEEDDLDTSAETDGSENSLIEKIKTEKTEEWSVEDGNIEEHLRRRLELTSNLAEKRLKKINILSQVRRRLVKRNATLRNIIVKLKTLKAVNHYRNSVSMDSINYKINGQNNDSEDYESDDSIKTLDEEILEIKNENDFS